MLVTRFRMTNAKTHWETVYRTKAPDAVSWYAPHLEDSLEFIRASGLATTSAVIDVGAGEATLVDDLLAAGYTDLTAMDISGHALEVCRERLGARASSVKWIEGDVLTYPFAPRSFDVWHDRAVFHFLTTDEQKAAYVAQVARAVRPGGIVIVGTFGPEGPEKCSGLPVSRYSADALHATFGARFEKIGSKVAQHTTPWGAPQQFVYCFCRVEA